jgi:hypothetical protein
MPSIIGLALIVAGLVMLHYTFTGSWLPIKHISVSGSTSGSGPYGQATEHSS